MLIYDIESNKNLQAFKEEKQILTTKVEDLEQKLYYYENKKTVDVSINTANSNRDLTQRKDIIELLVKNEGKMIFCSKTITENICKLLINNNDYSQKELEVFYKNLCTQAKNQKVLQEKNGSMCKTLNKRYDPADPNSIVDSTNSILASYSSQCTDIKAQYQTFGRPQTTLLKSKSRITLEKPIEKKDIKLGPKHTTAQNSSKNSFSDKENYIDIKAIIPSKCIFYCYFY